MSEMAAYRMIWQTWGGVIELDGHVSLATINGNSGPQFWDFVVRSGSDDAGV